MTPLYQTGNEEFTLYHGDTMELVGSLNKKVDMIFADPPYFLSKNIPTCINGTWKSFEKGEWDRVTSLKLLGILHYIYELYLPAMESLGVTSNDRKSGKNLALSKQICNFATK